jgi:hypothetical protein
MAINFTTGTINQPDAGSVGLAMAEKIRDDVVVHAAWDLVEEYTAASGLVRWYVFKCLAAQSGLSADFFVVMGRTLGSGELRFTICESYNSSTHVMSSVSAPGVATSYTFDSLGRYSPTVTLSTAALTSGYTAWIPSGVSTKWWICVDNDGFSVAFNGASNGFVHVGAYVPLSTLTNDLPIGIIGTGTSVTEGYIVRNPALASATAIGSGHYTNGGQAAGNSPPTPYLGFRSRLDANDKLQGNLRAVAEVGIAVHQWTASHATIGYVLGKQKRMRAGESNTAPAGIAFGDAYSLQGRLWVPYLPTDFRIWDTGVAA